ncbi:MAG: hypothetical protein O7E56_02410 [SAR324 cluster bacterium]|nr:hypothetical protein [SAR324 cluster bacterium]
MNWMDFLPFGAYAALGILSLLVWWLVYDFVLTPGLPVLDAVFGRNPNPAVALDILGGLLALGILNYSIITGPALGSLVVDIEATALTLLATIMLLGVLRLGTGGFLRLWFRKTRDAQGDFVTFNNELFKQRNLATGLFSTTLYLILAAGLVEEDLLDITEYRLEAALNMLGVWVLGAAAVLLHSLLYLGFGTRNHILHECFHDNNPAAATSMLGLVGGLLLLNNNLLESFEQGQHMFNQWELWAFLLAALAAVVVARLVLQLILLAFAGINLRRELVIRDNPAWGILDGGLIFVLFLILIAVVA